jgi:PAS domain S-box-containing protein
MITGDGLLSLLDAAVDALVITDAGGQIAGWNHAAEAMFGWAGEEAVGADMAELLVPEDQRERYRATITGLAADVAGRLTGGRTEIGLLRQGGQRVPVELAVSLIEDEGRSLCVASLRDISERKDAEARSRRSETVIASSGEAIWSGALDGTIESWNPAAERLYGYSEQEIVGRSAALLRPAADLEDFTREQWAVGAGDSVLLETAGQRKDGTLVDVAITLSPLCDGAGAVNGVVSVVRDVSEQNRNAARLAEAHSRFAGAFEAASTGMALVAQDGRFLAVNGALCELLARDDDTLMASSIAAVTHPEDLAISRRHSARALTGEIDSCQHAKRSLLPDGGIVWGLLTITVVRGTDAVPKYFVAQIQDITDRKTSEGELRRYTAQLDALSEQDPLTGLLNQPALEAALKEELHIFQLGGLTCSVLLAEVDGDEAAIVAAAASLARVSRDADRVAHLGDGTLVVLLPSVDTEGAGAILRRIREAITEQAPRSSHVTARPGETVPALLDRARAGVPHNARWAASGHAEPPAAGIARLLELARDQLGMAVSFLTRLQGNDCVFVHVAGDYERFGIAEGCTVPRNDTFCQQMLNGCIGSSVADLTAEPQARDLELTKRLALRAYVGVPVRLKSGEIYGTLCAADGCAHPELTERHVSLLGFLSELAAELIENRAEQQTLRRVQAGAAGVRTLLVALEARDYYTSEHSRRVVELAAGVARRLGLDPDVTRDVEHVALLHDIGKVGIPDSILQKQGPLDRQEWQLMRQHPVVGEHIIAGTPGLSHLAPAMRAEHERWDGSGYPDGLAREQIPLASRITLACDAFNAMTNDRPYRPAMTSERAQQQLRSFAGSQFDPQVVEVLLAEIAGSLASALPTASPASLRSA